MTELSEQRETWGRRFADKVVLVTGAASGIGRATAERLADEGATVVADRRERRRASRRPRRASATSAATVTTMRRRRQRSRVGAGRSCVDRRGSTAGIDVLCNIAGILRFNDLADTTLDDWNQILDGQPHRHVPDVPDRHAPPARARAATSSTPPRPPRSPAIRGRRRTRRPRAGSSPSRTWPSSSAWACAPTSSRPARSRRRSRRSSSPRAPTPSCCTASWRSTSARPGAHRLGGRVPRLRRRRARQRLGPPLRRGTA